MARGTYEVINTVTNDYNTNRTLVSRTLVIDIKSYPAPMIKYMCVTAAASNLQP